MEYIDIDQVYDVPDTPDREASNDKRNNGCVEIEINSSPSVRSKKKSRIFGEGFRNQAKGKSKLYIDDGLNKRLSFDAIRDPGISKGTNGNGGLSSSLTNLSTFKNANPFKKTVNPGNQHSLNFQHKEKGRENAVVDLTKSNGCAQAFELSSSQDNGHSTFAPNNYKGKEKIEFQGSSGANDSPPLRVHEVKRLVKNGDVSLRSLGNGKHIAENNSKGSVPVQKNVRSNVSDYTSDDLDLMRELVSDDNNLRRGKRQKSNLSLSKDVDIRNMSSRQFIAPARDVTENSSSVRDALKSFDAIGGWRNTHTLKTNPVFSAEEKNNNPQNERIDLRRLNRIGACPSSSTLVKKRKLGESSSSSSPDSDRVVIGSSQKAPNVRTGRNINKNGVGTLSSFIEIDELSPEMRCGDSANRESSGNNDSYAKAMQLEADEMLALELQEQMYSEMSQVGNPEIDEYIALAMQEEETSEHVFASTSLLRPRERGPSNVNRRSRFRSSQIPLARPTTRARNFHPSRLTRLRSQVSGRSPRVPVGQRIPNFPPDMDLDMRMYIMETLEDMGVANSDFQVDRDFNENDYEMLLGLDENNHRHAGASVHMINRLPQSTVQNGNTEDCAVCLETPSMGDVLRILPCFHKFHKDCIDPWLRRNTSCPVCKSSVT